MRLRSRWLAVLVVGSHLVAGRGFAQEASPEASPSPPSSAAEEKARDAEIEEMDVPEDAPAPEVTPAPEATPEAPPPPEAPAAAEPIPAAEPTPAPPTPEPTPQPTPTPAPASPLTEEPAPIDIPAPDAKTQPTGDEDKAGLLDKIGTFSDIEQLDLAELISAAGSEKTYDDAPGLPIVVTEEDIRRSGARTFEQVLEMVPGFEVLTDNLGHGRIVVRGVPSSLSSGSSEGVLVLINGIRANDNTFGGSTFVNLDLPVENIKKVEILRGGGWAFHGPGAYQAVISITTESVSTFRRDELTLGGGSFRSAFYALRYGTTIGSVSMAGFMQFRYRHGADMLIPADIATVNDALVGGKPTSFAPAEVLDKRKSVDANLAVAYRELLLSIRLKAENGGGFIGPFDAFGPQNQLSNRQTQVDLEYHKGRGRIDVHGRIGFADTKSIQLLDILPAGFTSRTGSINLPSGALMRADLNTWRIGADGWGEGIWGAHTVRAGLGIEREATYDLHADANIVPQTFVQRPEYGALADDFFPDASRTVFSLWVQDTFSPAPKLTVTSGTRLEAYGGSADQGGRDIAAADDGTHLLPRIGAVYKLPKDVSLKLQYGRGLRTPSFAERLFVLPGFVPDPLAEPSRTDTFELGAIYRRQDLRLAGTAFYTSLRDALAAAAVPGSLARDGFTTYAVTNIGDVHTRGLELEAMYNFDPRRSVQAMWTIERATFADSDDRIPGVPTHLLYFAGHLPAGKYIDLAPQLTVRSSRPRAAGDARPPIDGYALFDVAVRASNFNPSLEFAAELENLFDTEYVDPSPLGGLPGDYPRPGRTFFIKAKYKF